MQQQQPTRPWPPRLVLQRPSPLKMPGALGMRDGSSIMEARKRGARARVRRDTAGRRRDAAGRRARRVRRVVSLTP